MAEQMRLTLSPEKTAITHVDDGFDLLGFRIVRAPWRGSKRVAYVFPSQHPGALGTYLCTGPFTPGTTAPHCAHVTVRTVIEFRSLTIAGAPAANLLCA
jgi:hypothetical protein